MVGPQYSQHTRDLYRRHLLIVLLWRLDIIDLLTYWQHIHANMPNNYSAGPPPTSPDDARLR